MACYSSLYFYQSTLQLITLAVFSPDADVQVTAPNIFSIPDQEIATVWNMKSFDIT